MNLEIHIKDTQCRVIEGPARRVRYTTPEAVALALLQLRPENTRFAGATRWMDYLAGRGVAIGLVNDSLVGLLTYPAMMRTIPYRHTAQKDHIAEFPPLLMASHFKAGKLVKSSLWVIKASAMPTLGISVTASVLAPFPYGNVYDHGGICWGSASTKDVREPDETIQTFFQSGFNGDLFNPAPIGAGSTPYHDFLQTYDGKALPLPRESCYSKSMTALVQDIFRV
jgi:hypothetical protein